MTYAQTLHRSGLTAIAAVLALSSTPAFAQDTSATPPVIDSPASEPVSDPLSPADPVTTTTTTTTTETPASDPLAPETTAPEATAAPAVTRRTTTTRRTTSLSRSTASTAVRAAPSAPAEVAPSAPIAPLSTAPVAPVIAEPLPLEVVPPTESTVVALDEDVLPIAGAAAFGLLLLGGTAAVALRRRRRREAEEFEIAEYHEPAFAAEPVAAEPMVERPAPVAARVQPEPSAFGWNGTSAGAAATPAAALPSGIDPSTLGDHTKAAYRGPSPDNPSLSLKKRLKRAAFFEQRERLAAKGEAVPVSPGAGLPDAMAKKADRVNGAITARTVRPMTYRPVFQPA